MSKTHAVKLGECISSIAFEYGFFPDTIWNHPQNAGLKSLRRDMNVLNPSDPVFIPDKRPRDEPGSTGLTHRFRLRGTPVKFQLQLSDGDQPRAGVAYRLTVDQQTFEGVTGSDGMVDQWIPANARRGVLWIDDGAGGVEFPFQLGHLQPVREDSGVRDRLENLALLEHGGDEAALKRAVLAFIDRHCPEHRPTGEVSEFATGTLLNDAVRKRLVEIHGS
jgi:hypothetical protein